MIAVRYSGRTYSAHQAKSGYIIVTANNGQHIHTVLSELSAYLWLGNHGLRRGRIQKLLDAAVRGTGPYSSPDHPKRVKRHVS